MNALPGDDVVIPRTQLRRISWYRALWQCCVAVCCGAGAATVALYVGPAAVHFLDLSCKAWAKFNF